jgi:head-tail adaptor
VVVEAIKLLEGQMADQFDAIWVVDATEEKQLERLAQRGISRLEALKRIRVQNPQTEKLARANTVITNNGTPEETWAQVQLGWSQIQWAAEEEEIQAQPQRVEVDASSTVRETGQMEITSLDIIRGMPRNAEQIAALIREKTGEELDRTDVLMAFGQKSYMLAMANETLVGLVGFLVENLVTRVDQFIVVPQAPVAPVSSALIQAIERASRELQSEVGYVFLPVDEPQNLIQVLLDEGYIQQELEDIKVPAWREAAREARPDGHNIFAKKLRAERVLKPL